MQNKEPESSQSTPLLPMLSFEDAAAAIRWYELVLGARETARLTSPDGKIGYCELWIGQATLSVADLWPELNHTPRELGGTPVVLNLQVENVDEVFARALEQGAKEILPVDDRFYGDRSGRIEDPFGYIWILSRRIEEVAMAEMQRRFNEMSGGE